MIVAASQKAVLTISTEECNREATYIYGTKECHGYVHRTSRHDLYGTGGRKLGRGQGTCVYAHTLREVVVAPKRVCRVVNPDVAYPPESLQQRSVRK